MRCAVVLQIGRLYRFTVVGGIPHRAAVECVRNFHPIAKWSVLVCFFLAISIGTLHPQGVVGDLLYHAPVPKACNLHYAAEHMLRPHAVIGDLLHHVPVPNACNCHPVPKGEF